MLPALLFTEGPDGAALDLHVLTRVMGLLEQCFLASLHDPGCSLFSVLPLFRVIFLRDVLSTGPYFICVLWVWLYLWIGICCVDRFGLL